MLGFVGVKSAALGGNHTKQEGLVVELFVYFKTLNPNPHFFRLQNRPF